MYKFSKTKLFQTISHVFQSPKTFFKYERYSIEDSLRFLFGLSVLASIITTISFFPFRLIGLYEMSAEYSAYFSQLYIVVFDLIISSLLFGLFSVTSAFTYSFINHLFLRVFGGKATFRETLVVQFFIQIPGIMFSWLPFIGRFLSIVMGIYGFYLGVIGFSVKHKLSKTKTFIALLLPLLAVPLAVILFLMLYSKLITLILSYLPVGPQVQDYGFLTSEVLKIIESLRA